MWARSCGNWTAPSRPARRIPDRSGRLALQPKLATAGDLSGPFDLIFLSVKGYALEAAMQDLAPAVGPGSMILPVLNGMAHMDRLEARFGYGELDGTVSERIRAVDAALQGLVDRGHAKRVETPLLQAATTQLHIYQAVKAGGRGRPTPCPWFRLGRCLVGRCRHLSHRWDSGKPSE
jgi:hypothetical protein